MTGATVAESSRAENKPQVTNAATAKVDYREFASELAWDLNELEFRTRAALSILHSSQDIDSDSGGGLALSYVMQGIVKRIEELASHASDSEFKYELKSTPNLGNAHGGPR